MESQLDRHPPPEWLSLQQLIPDSRHKRRERDRGGMGREREQSRESELEVASERAGEIEKFKGEKIVGTGDKTVRKYSTPYPS